MIQDTGGKRFRRKTSMLLTEINVTPFVDVMLVLLVIFMVTTPLMQSGINVSLPKEEAGSLDIRQENVVTVRKDGAVFFNDKRMTLEDLEDRLRSLAAAAPSSDIFLQADEELSYGAVVGVMGVMKRAGVERLGMVTQIPPARGGG
ncbi:MAG: ExbD/TolR family protein [Candidatus Nitrospinota bacterium M3_3B_026]